MKITDLKYSKIQIDVVLRGLRLSLCAHDSAHSHGDLVLLLIDLAVNYGEAIASLPLSHTYAHASSWTEPRVYLVIPPPSSSEALVRRIVFGTLTVQCDDHGASYRGYRSSCSWSSSYVLLGPLPHLAVLPFEQQRSYDRPHDRAPDPAATAGGTYPVCLAIRGNKQHLSFS
jgi:hypothetical protein